MPSPEKVVQFGAQIQKKRKEEKESEKLADIENRLNDLREKKSTVELIAREDLCGVGFGPNNDRPLVIKGVDGKFKRCGISGDDIDVITSDEIEVESYDGSHEEAVVWQGLVHPTQITGDAHKVIFVRSFLVLFSLLKSFPKTFVERILSHLFPLVGFNYRHVTVARAVDEGWRDIICKILKKGISISHLDVIESARKICADKLNEAIESYLNELCDPPTFIESVKAISRGVANCSQALGYSEDKSNEMDDKLKGIPAATRKIRAVHRRWTKDGGTAPDSDSMIDKVITAHRSNVEKTCARVEVKPAECADVAIVSEITTEFIESLSSCLVIRVSNDPTVDGLPCLTLMSTLSPPEKGELVEPSYLSILSVKDGKVEDTEETKKLIINCGIGSIIVERVNLPNLVSDKKIFVDGFDIVCIKDLVTIVESYFSTVYCTAEEYDKWRDYIKEACRKRNNLK